MSALAVANLTRLYKNGRGVRNVNLSVSQGEVFGFLGPNGAGKTTLIRTIMGFQTPDQGTIAVLGLDAVKQSREARRRIGYLPSDPALYDFLTGRQNIELSLRLRGAAGSSRAQQLADRLEINLDRRLKGLSRGNKQKVAIVAALAHDPDLIILDEPTSGLDPLVQERFMSLVLAEKRRGKTVFISSHIMSEVETLCDRVGVIRDGEIITVDTVEHLRKQRVKYVSVRFSGTAPDLTGLGGVRDWQVEGDKATCTFGGDLNPLVTALAQHRIVDLTVTDPPLEEVFRTFYEGGGGGK